MFSKNRTDSVSRLVAFAILIVVVPASSVMADPLTVIQDLDEAYVQIAQWVSPAVVRVSSVHSSSGAAVQKFGSGFIVSPDGLIMTNYHVVQGLKEIKVTLTGKREFIAHLIGADPESDLAVIKIGAENLPNITWGDSQKLRVGEIVIAVGNPFGLSGTVTSGIVSATGRTNVGIIGYEDFIQTDTPINPGNSGGPLVNIRGEVIGVTSAIASRSGGYMGIGFAIPSNPAKLVMDELLRYGKVQRGFLGINLQDLNDALAKSFGLTGRNGTLISEIIPGSPAEKAGVKAGDIVLNFNDQAVIGASELKNFVGATKPGTLVKLGIIRARKNIEIDVMASERAPLVPPSIPSTRNSSDLGITVEKASQNAAQGVALKPGQGFLIKEINPQGLGAVMGLLIGDVILEINDSEVPDVSALEQGAVEAKRNGVIRLKIRRGSNTIYLAEILE